MWSNEADGGPVLRVLGIDVASAEWSSNGSATIAFDPVAKTFASIEVPAVKWPTLRLTPATLANAIDMHVRAHGICAVALDGPQGWRDPATPGGIPGVGRRCEYECLTQGKTGIYPQTYPSTQRTWIEFCIDLFTALLNKRGVQLAAAAAPLQPPAVGYLVLECYPTSAWRLSGLKPLPGKTKRPTLPLYATQLAQAYGLPPCDHAVKSHDDLQAVVAALVAASIVGGPATPVRAGVAASEVGGPTARRVEGFIWNVRPRAGTALLDNLADSLLT
jgi:hypothetical protein